MTTRGDAEPRKVVLARIRDRQHQMACLSADAYRQWWRPLRSRRLLRAARELRELNERDFEKLGFPRDAR